MARWQKVLIIVSSTLVGGMFLFYMLFLNHVTVNQIGAVYDPIKGTVTKQEQPGWYLTNPLVRVACISTLPMKVTIPSSARIIVQKVVRFKPEGLDEYIKLQGFSYQLNSSLESVLLGYAFSGKEYSFMEIMQEPTSEKD